MEYTKDFLPITDICLNVTEACNLACVYCFTEHHPNYMTLDVAKDAAQWLHDNAILSSQIQKLEVIPNIGFFGGEPTLMWDSIIVPLIKWIKEKGWIFSFGITSNCVLLDKEKVDFMIENNIGLLISMDGDEYSQNINRPCKNSQLKSFDLVSKNLKYIAKHYPESTYRSTITPKTAPYIFHNLMYAGEMGFQTVFSIINEFEDWSDENKKTVEQELDKYCLYVIDACIKKQPFVRLRPLELAINKILAVNSFLLFNPSDDGIEQFGPEEEHRCGMGSGYGSINYKGEIYSCQEVASRQGEKDIFYIGNIYEGIDFERVKKLRKNFLNRKKDFYNYEDEEKCKDCISKATCKANLCPVNNYIMYKDFSANTDAWCWWTSMILEKAMNLLFILGVNSNDFFKEYIFNQLYQQGGLFHAVK